jgi:hypothetical protein
VTGPPALELAQQATKIRDDFEAAASHISTASKWLFPKGDAPRKDWDVKAYRHPNPHVGTIAHKTKGGIALIHAENAFYTASWRVNDLFKRTPAAEQLRKQLDSAGERLQGIGHAIEDIADFKLKAEHSPVRAIDASGANISPSVRGRLAELKDLAVKAAATFDSVRGALLTQATS